MLVKRSKVFKKLLASLIRFFSACKDYDDETDCNNVDTCAYVNTKCQPQGNLVFVILYHRFKEWKPLSKKLFENISKFIKCKNYFKDVGFVHYKPDQAEESPSPKTFGFGSNSKDAWKI